jgi:hypothetical protein
MMILAAKTRPVYIIDITGGHSCDDQTRCPSVNVHESLLELRTCKLKNTPSFAHNIKSQAPYDLTMAAWEVGDRTDTYSA